jgi:hypothetical protein
LKKIPLLITLGVILLILAGYYAYEKILTKKQLTPWDLVPADAIIVYEKNNCAACDESLSQSSLLTSLDRAAFYKKANDSVRNKISALLKDKNAVLISTHVTKKDEFDFVYYASFNDAAPIRQILNSTSYRHTSREFNSIQIEEIRFQDQLFSYAFIENVWIGSFTPFLIEDVVRTYKSNTHSFRKSALSQQGFTSIQDDAGNLYVQLNRFDDLLSLFLTNQSELSFSIGKSALLDIKTNDNSLVLNGFSIDSVDHSNYMLSVFQHQSPVTFGLKHLIPNRTLAVSSYGISDGTAFLKDLSSFTAKRNPALRDTLVRLSKANKLDIENLYPQIADEISVCSFESPKGKTVSKILLVETKNAEKWIATFNKIAAKLSVDTIFYERYADYEIREVPIFRFPEKLFWPLVKGFNQTFFSSIGNIIIISEDMAELKRFLDDIEAEDTWGKSVAQNKFLESTLLESNFSLYVNPSRSWNLISQQLQPRWQYFLRENLPVLQAIQMSAIQFSHLNNSYYTNILFTYKSVAVSEKSPGTASDKTVATFEKGILNIHPVRSHVNRGNEILLQDSLNDLSLLSSDGKVLWKIAIGDKIVSEVNQIDFFNNGKLQYLFATSKAIHIIDRLGNYVDPYPVYLSSVEISYLSIIDYDNSKKYRFLVADQNGKLWMYDKEGRSLEGWQPKEIGGNVAMAPRHYRIKGKDYLLAVRTDGQVYLMNRRGENLKKFPLNSEAVPAGDCYLEAGNTLANTYFVIVSRDGFRIKFTVEGKVQSREALLKTAVSSVFSLVNEKSGKSYIVLQQDGRQLTLTGESGKKILSAGISGLTSTDVKYFDFGGGKEFFVLNDRTQGVSYVYDGDGNLITTPPIVSTAVEIRSYNSDQFKIFYVQGRSLIIQPF